MINLNNHWDNVDFNNRHIIEGLTEQKINRHIDNFNNLYIKYVNTNKINSSLHWGS